jgi:formylglycine-generating enzyme
MLRKNLLFAGSVAVFLAAPLLHRALAAAPSDGARAPGTTFRDCRDCPRMVVVPAGAFTMGSPAGTFREGIDGGYEHRVRIEKAFAIGKFDITRGEYAQFARETNRPSSSHCYVWSTRINNWIEGGRGRTWRDPGFEQSDDHPVVCVSSFDANAYVRWLNAKVSGSEDRPYRLPSDEEWEYAARAGTTTKYYWGDEPSRGRANFGSLSSQPFGPAAAGRDRWLHTSPVGSFPPNGFGLYDMAGNVVQLTGSCMSDASYENPATGPCKIGGFLKNNENAVITRGGSWLDIPDNLGSSVQTWVDQPALDQVMGFRVVRDLD